jgi:uncharacterized membrane protein YkvA (DUF1232 family)
MSDRAPLFFERFKKLSTELVKNPSKLLDELIKADKKTEEQKDKIGGFIEDLKLLIRFIRAWIRGEYKNVPILTIILVVAAIIYFVSPIDAIPDFIPIIGYIDDAAVVTFVIASIKHDLNNFRKWEEEKIK